MLRRLWLIVAGAMFVGGATALGLSAMWAGGRWWYGARWPEPRVGALAEAVLVLWVLAAGARHAAGPRPPRPEAAGDYAEGRGGAVPDGRAEPGAAADRAGGRRLRES